MLPLHLREYKRLLLACRPYNRGREREREITQVALRFLRNGADAMKNPFEYIGIAYDMAWSQQLCAEANFRVAGHPGPKRQRMSARALRRDADFSSK